MVKTTNEKVIANLIWRFAERSGAQLVQFIVSIILARFLAPEAYGTIALVTVFITIFQVFVDSGLGNALIQKKDADDIDFSTVFYTNIIFCFILYSIIWFIAPLIANFYQNKQLILIIRILSLTVIIAGVKNVQQAYVSKHLLFKKFFYSTIGGTISAAIIGIIMAYLGFGVWALIAQQLLNLTVDTIILWITVKWRPKKIFSIKRLKSLYTYGWKLLASSLLDNVYENTRQLIIGKMYTPSNLAYYNRGKQLPSLIVTNINSSIDSVLLPTMSNAQDDKERVRNMTRRAIKISVYIMAPLMIGLAVTGSNVIRLILTDKWLACTPYLVIFCITYLFYPIHTANLNAIKAMGRSDLFLKLEIIKKVVGFIIIFISMWFGVMSMVYSMLLISILSQIINSWPNKKLLRYSYLEQLKDIMPSIILAILMGLCIKPIEFFGLSTFVTLVLQVISGMILYIGFSILFKIDSFYYLWGIITPILNKRFNKNRIQEI